jgi:hypothetical protein
LEVAGPIVKIKNAEADIHCAKRALHVPLIDDIGMLVEKYKNNRYISKDVLEALVNVLDTCAKVYKDEEGD